MSNCWPLLTRKRKGADRRKQRDQFERKRQPQDGFTLIEALIVAAIVAIIVILVIGTEKNRHNFERACEKTGGDTVWDGRQYQCLKRQPQE